MNQDAARIDDVRTEDGHEFYVVRPAGDSRGPGIVYLHWFDEAPNANRSQFLDEARFLAAVGVSSVLPQLTFPWQHAPSDIGADLGRIGSEVVLLRRAHSMLTEIDGVDPSRIAVVGHDFGAMFGTLLLREIEARCGVLVAATPRWADWFLRFWPIATDRFDYMRQMAAVDPITVIREITCPLLIQAGERDFYIAAMSARELTAAAPQAARYVSYDTGHAMDLDEIRDDRVGFLVDHLDLDL